MRKHLLSKLTHIMLLTYENKSIFYYSIFFHATNTFFDGVFL